MTLFPASPRNIPDIFGHAGKDACVHRALGHAWDSLVVTVTATALPRGGVTDPSPGSLAGTVGAVGFYKHQPRERLCGLGPGEPGPGKSPAAGARRPPGHHGSHKGTFTPGRTAGVWGSPAPPAPGQSPPCPGPSSCQPWGTARTGDRLRFPSRPEPGHPAAGPEKISLCPETC